MALIIGTAGADSILLDSLSAGVTTDPTGVTGTRGEANEIHAGAGSDRVEASDFGDWVHGDAGRDLLIGGSGWDILDGGTGADRMFGGDGLDFYIVDSHRDVVRDDGTTEFDVADFIVTDLNYTLSETAGVECLLLGDDFGIAATRRTVYGGGNSHDNTIEGNAFANVLDGKGGNDVVQGLAGDDRVLGGRGNDDVQGWEGRDLVRGQDGDDSVWGGSGRDTLVGGRGHDTFFFNYADESVGGARDAIVAGDGAIAFQGAGAAAGDLIWMPNAPSADSPPEDAFVYDFGAWVFGGTGKGHVSCVDHGQDTLVRANIDDDSVFEFQLLIKDGAVRASAYTADDFFLGP
ncbi:MAG: calcium-binding protein [Amaricoccus sp.]